MITGYDCGPVYQCNVIVGENTLKGGAMQMKE